MKTYMGRKIISIGISDNMICKHCGKPAAFYWFDKDKTSGQSERFHRDMHEGCYEASYGKKPLFGLPELNEKRRRELQGEKI